MASEQSLRTINNNFQMLLLFYNFSYTQHNERGVKPECQYCFDLEVPEDFQPIVVDGEVEKFELFPMQQAWFS